MSEQNLPVREILRHPRLRESIGNATREWFVTSQQCPPLFQEFGIGLAGWSRARDGFLFIRPNPTHGQVLACFGGQGEVLVNNEWVSCTEGHAYLTPPHVFHAYRAIPGEPWRIAWLHDYNRWVSGAPRVVPAHSDDFYTVLHGLYREVTGAAEVTVMKDWLRLIRVHTLRIVGADLSPGRLRSLWDAVAADPAHDWSLPEMTRWIGVSEEHLRRLSIAETGQSPMRQVTAIRMRHAESLLASGRYTITEVSARVGYDNPFAFSTAFKRIMGNPPSTFLPNSHSQEHPHEHD